VLDKRIEDCTIGTDDDIDRKIILVLVDRLTSWAVATCRTGSWKAATRFTARSANDFDSGSENP
jgi:hypothetical protein